MSHMYYICVSVSLSNRVFVIVLSLSYKDVDECLTTEGGGVCQQVCTNLPGSFLCDCDPGFTLDSDQVNCVGSSHHTSGVSLPPLGKFEQNWVTSVCIGLHVCVLMNGYIKGITETRGQQGGWRDL